MKFFLSIESFEDISEELPTECEVVRRYMFLIDSDNNKTAAQKILALELVKHWTSQGFVDIKSVKSVADSLRRNIINRWVVWEFWPQEGACEIPVPKCSDQGDALDFHSWKNR